MQYPYQPPKTQIVDGVLYHLSKWHYSNDYATVYAEYYIDFDFEHTTYDSVIYRKFDNS